MYSICWEGWQYTGNWEGNDEKGHGIINHELKNPDGNIVSFEFRSNIFPTHQDLIEWVAQNG